MFYPLSHILKTWRMKKWVGSYGLNIKHYWEHNLSQFFHDFFSENNVISFANNKYQNMILTQMAKWRKCQKKLLPFSTAICRTKYHAQKIVLPYIQTHDPLKNVYTHKASTSLYSNFCHWYFWTFWACSQVFKWNTGTSMHEQPVSAMAILLLRQTELHSCV